MNYNAKMGENAWKYIDIIYYFQSNIIIACTLYLTASNKRNNVKDAILARYSDFHCSLSVRVMSGRQTTGSKLLQYTK